MVWTHSLLAVGTDRLCLFCHLPLVETAPPLGMWTCCSWTIPRPLIADAEAESYYWHHWRFHATLLKPHLSPWPHQFSNQHVHRSASHFDPLLLHPTQNESIDHSNTDHSTKETKWLALSFPAARVPAPHYLAHPLHLSFYHSSGLALVCSHQPLTTLLCFDNKRTILPFLDLYDTIIWFCLNRKMLDSMWHGILVANIAAGTYPFHCRVPKSVVCLLRSSVASDIDRNQLSTVMFLLWSRYGSTSFMALCSPSFPGATLYTRFPKSTKLFSI